VATVGTWQKIIAGRPFRPPTRRISAEDDGDEGGEDDGWMTVESRRTKRSKARTLVAETGTGAARDEDGSWILVGCGGENSRTSASAAAKLGGVNRQKK
jgi:hypothetical protein